MVERDGFSSALTAQLRLDGAINCGELNALGASFVVDKMGFDDQSHDAPPNWGQIRILALAIKYRLPPLWFALLHGSRMKLAA